jgi:voltage-gated potassium channel
MTAITVSTVGFGTLKQAMTPADKTFVILLTLTSSTVFIYAISNITAFLVEGTIRNHFKQKNMNKKIDKLANHVIICGLGRNGREAARELQGQHQPFVIIEPSLEIIHAYEAEDHLNLLYVQGDATLEETLLAANIKTAKGLVSTLPSDAENVYITLTARELNPKIQVVARATTEEAMARLRRAGATHIVNPYMMGGRRMANILTRPQLVEFIELITGEDNAHLQLAVLECDTYPVLLTRPLSFLLNGVLKGVNVLGIRNKGNTKISLNLDHNRPLKPGDRLFVIGESSKLAELRKNLEAGALPDR